MKRNRHCSLLKTLFFAGMVLLSCKHTVTTIEPVPNRATPSWVLFKPDEPTRFHGIGNAPLSLDPEKDQADALENARANLLSEIKAGFPFFLSAKNFPSTDLPDILWTDFAHQLDEILPSDTFVEERRRRVWAYVSLSTGAFEEMLIKRRRSLEPRARKELDEARESRQEGDLVNAIQKTAAAFRRVSGPEGLMMAGQHEGTSLRADAEEFLRGLLEDVKIVRVDGPERCRASGLHDVRLVVDAVHLSRGRPLSGMPILFQFAKGSGRIDTNRTTNSDGRCASALTALDPRVSPVEIDATLDLAAMISRSHLEPLPEEVLSHFPLPSTRFSIELDPPRLLLTNIERGGTGGDRGAFIINELAEALRKQGLDVQEANVDYLVNPEVFKKVEAGQDPGEVENTDLVGVVAISLNRIRKQKGQFQEVLYGEGEALFRLFDLQQHALVMDVRMKQEVSGFSQGDVERNFFLRSIDELRAKVLDTLAEDTFTGHYR